MELQLPSYATDPVRYLSIIAGQTPSSDLCQSLAGSVAWFIRDESRPPISALYVQAAARHLAAVETGLSSDASQRGKHIREVIEAVGAAASKCTHRSVVTQSGILPILAGFLSPSFLSVAHVEFLQCALLAGQYRFARRAMGHTWPRPTAAVSVQQVLRYYYYRGMIHMGCDEWTLAARCFWTCLTIPSEFVSAIVEEAWKKMVLVQCLLWDKPYPPPTIGSGKSESPLQLPTATPPCITRFLQMASSSIKKKQMQQQQHWQQQQTQQQQQQQPGAPEASGQDEITGMLGDQATETDSPEYARVAAYMELVNAFETGDRQNFANIQLENRTLFEADGNMGMVNRCETELCYQTIFRLSRIYSVIDLPQLASMLQLPPPKVQDLLWHLSLEGRLDARVESDGWVVFEDPPIQLCRDEADMNLQHLVELTERLQKLDANVATSTRYQCAVKASRSVGPRGVEDL